MNLETFLSGRYLKVVGKQGVLVRTLAHKFHVVKGFSGGNQRGDIRIGICIYKAVSLKMPAVPTRKEPDWKKN